MLTSRATSGAEDRHRGLQQRSLLFVYVKANILFDQASKFHDVSTVGDVPNHGMAHD